MALYIIVIAFLIIYIGFVVAIYRLDHRITELSGKVQQLKTAMDEDYHGFAEDVVDLREKLEALEKALKDLTLRVDSLTPSKGFSGDLNTILNYQPSKMKRMKQKRGEE